MVLTEKTWGGNIMVNHSSAVQSFRLLKNISIMRIPLKVTTDSGTL
jgi:hypothetical protein